VRTIRAGAAQKRDVLLSWDELPEFMRTPEVRPYWEILWKHRTQLIIKRAFDVLMSIALIILLLVPMIVIAVMIKLDSEGPIIYRQERVTRYGRRFKINKFRTMYDSASAVDKNGVQVGASITVANDDRITKIGQILRKNRMDEFPQLFNVLSGDMSFVGTRPEIPKYVEQYKNVWNATLLLPPGITSECSIRFKDEYRLLNDMADVDKTYVELVLPEKMKINLKSLQRFSFMHDIGTMIDTAAAVIGRDS
jgi:lipopolysaccharide/colanic/teichoic acid biosynthesis glycosyltransferase